MFHVPCINPNIKFFKRSTNALECMNVILLHSNHQHVLTTHVNIFRVVRTRIKLQLSCVRITPELKNPGGSLFHLYHSSTIWIKIHYMHLLCTSSTALYSMYNNFLSSNILYLPIRHIFN
jgi:hypothetical protein